MNLITKFNLGQADKSQGIPFGRGLEKVTLTVSGVQSSKIYGVAGPPKAGKSTLADYGFVLEPYLFALKHRLKIRWIYFSFEIDRVSKEFDFLVFFLNRDYNVQTVDLPEGVFRDGESFIELNSTYLKGILMDDNFKPIKINPVVYEYIKEIYEDRIIPLFGEYDSEGYKISEGLIDFREGRENPTGVYNYMVKDAKKHGKIFTEGTKSVGYQANDPDMLTIVVLDHMRKLKPERGYQMKQNIDKMSEYMVILRNLLGWTFVPILHTNRNLTSGERFKAIGQDIYPTSDDLKDSGNLAEDCDYIFTIFNPNDDKYNIKEHFGFKIKDSRGGRLYPDMRTIHLVESRHCEFPAHFRVNMKGGLKSFEAFK